MVPRGPAEPDSRGQPPAGPSNLPSPPGSGRAAGPGGGRLAAPALGDDCWLDAEIVSVDSMAVYRGLDIGTAKPSAAEQAAVPHHLIDVVEPGEAYSVARWLADAAAAVAAIRGRGRRVLFVGGTPLFLRALRDGIDAVPAADPEARARLAAEVAAVGSPALHERLVRLDPAAAARIHPNDARRIIRALEVAEQGGAGAAAAWSAASGGDGFAGRLLVIDLPRSILRERIDRRVEAMFAAGLVAETRAALARPGGIGPTAAQAAGYAEALDVIAGRLDEPAALARVQVRTRQLAKRQLTWLRSFREAIWLGA
jgi:tRNA dimethylallyltransferase